MTALPERSARPSPGADRLLTIAEYSELGAPDSGYTELVEGRILMSPSPAPQHNIASGELYVQLRTQLPDQLRVIQDVDVDLGLAPAGGPGFSRRPDLVVVKAEAVERVSEHGGMLRAAEVVVVIEIVSPGSHRIDHVDKHGEYADAGIGHYWIVDLAAPVSLIASHLAGELGYQDAPAVAGAFTAAEPFDVTLDLDALG
jgi:Uma2 family endonuclease